jgi:hypothetical protein
MKRGAGFPFELPNAFRKFWGTSPPMNAPKENRNVADVLAHPCYGFYNPDDLHFPEKTVPVVPSSGGYQTMGGGMIAYNHQATWDRGCQCDVGPVNETFQQWMTDHRIRHV